MGQTFFHEGDEKFAIDFPKSNMVLQYWLKERSSKDSAETS